MVTLKFGLDIVMGVFMTNQMHFQRILSRTKSELSLHLNSVDGTCEGRIFMKYFIPEEFFLNFKFQHKTVRK